MTESPERKTNKQRLKEITDGIEQGIKDLFESDRYRQYLSVMSRFHRYSLNNTLLIYMQKPDASLVAGYNKWKDNFGRYVKKGERGITIIAPTPFKKKVEEIKLDPDTKAPLLDKDGNAIMEEKEINIPMFKPVKVFDVSQTDGKPLPQLAASLSGKVEQYDVFVEALRRSAPVPITFQALAQNMDGFFSPKDQSITIREGMSEVQTISALVHEIAHSKLHKLENRDLSHIPILIMDEDRLSVYATYMGVLGNRPDLFPDSRYIGLYIDGDYTRYEIPPEALTDEKFAAMIREGEKYLGYPYVWGGSNPSTSFDCSGFVSWVLNHSGWNVGRQTAQGLCNLCTPVSSANARPGDLVFFKGTYDTPGVSHVGIYVGNGWFLHCGDPISYANLNTNYWRNHFYQFGRLP